MRPRHITLAILLAAALFLAGCAGGITDQPDQGEEKTAPGAIGTEPESGSIIPSETLAEEIPDRDQRPAQSPPPGLERTDITPPAPVTGEVPAEIMEPIIADLVERTGASQNNIIVIRAESVVWNDGALGCPKTGEFYIQVLISGYRVVLEVEGIGYDYRVSDKGSFKLCEGGSVVPINPPEADNQNPLVLQAKEDLADRLGVPMSEIELLSFEEVVWPDSSIGCPQPGMRYKQVPYDGALIRLSADGQVYDYHSGGSRGPFLCEKAYKEPEKPTPIDITKLTTPAPDNSIPPGEDQ
jgi:hypothetical protein